MAGLRLVVVDNDPAVLDLLLMDLRLEGHDVLATAGSGGAAIDACAEYSPDVLVVDLRLGDGIDGIEVARRVRRPGLRIVLHTNYVNPGTVRRASEVGATVVEKGSLATLRRAVAGGV